MIKNGFSTCVEKAYLSLLTCVYVARHIPFASLKQLRSAVVGGTESFWVNSGQDFLLFFFVARRGKVLLKNLKKSLVHLLFRKGYRASSGERKKSFLNEKRDKSA